MSGCTCPDDLPASITETGQCSRCEAQMFGAEPSPKPPSTERVLRVQSAVYGLVAEWMEHGAFSPEDCAVLLQASGQLAAMSRSKP